MRESGVCVCTYVRMYADEEAKCWLLKRDAFAIMCLLQVQKGQCMTG